MRAEAVVVVREAWRAHPLSWIHRVEARAIARDPVMRRAVKEIQAPYCGPGSAALERCYDKYEAHRLVTAAGIDAPRTFLASEAGELQAPFVLKPRRGSDSIGVRIVRSVPAAKRDAHHVVQELVLGEEITIAVFRDQVGASLRILLPPGAPYSFMRKYLFRPRRSVVEERALSERIRESATRAARCLGVDWSARTRLSRRASPRPGSIAQASSGGCWTKIGGQGRRAPAGPPRPRKESALIGSARARREHQAALRSMGKSGGELPAWMVPSSSKPWRS